ncbi:unnamed protein product [Larinioides sclopetarius]|uniref:ATP synthase F0 subunit 8 n=1 Tax=Larinioides sclopetarius TaxID=280406 RepID=A0AAV1YVY6_9ARAC
MNAIMVLTKVVVSFVVVLVYLMHIIARNVPFKKKIEMDVQRSLTWVAQRQICFMKERNMVLRKGDPGFFILILEIFPWTSLFISFFIKHVSYLLLKILFAEFVNLFFNIIYKQILCSLW